MVGRTSPRVTVTPTSLPGTKSAPALEAENARLRTANEQLQARLRTETAGKPVTPPPTAASDSLRALDEAFTRSGVAGRVKLMTLDGKLDGAFASLFDLKPEEVQTLETALAQAKQTIEQLIAANMTVNELGWLPDATNGWHAYKVNVRAFEGGREVYADLLQRFAATLGTERNAIFRTLEDDQLSRYLADYGEHPKLISVYYHPPFTNGEPTYRVIEQTARDAEAPESFSFRTNQIETLRAHYGVLLRDLPPAFLPKR